MSRMTSKALPELGTAQPQLVWNINYTLKYIGSPTGPKNRLGRLSGLALGEPLPTAKLTEAQGVNCLFLGRRKKHAVESGQSFAILPFWAQIRPITQHKYINKYRVFISPCYKRRRIS